MQLPSVSALKNIEDSIRYTNTPDDGWETFKTTVASTAGGIVGGFIPAPLRHAASVTDESERDTSGNNQAERALNQIKSGIPGLRQTLPVKTDNYGNPEYQWWTAIHPDQSERYQQGSGEASGSNRRKTDARKERPFFGEIRRGKGQTHGRGTEELER